MSHQPETCPDCEAGQLRSEVYSDKIEHRGHTLRLDELVCLVCDNCAAEVFRPEEIRHNERIMAEARRLAGGLPPAE